MSNKTLILAHYYTTPEVQALADKVGDSLELSRFAASQQADRIVFAGVRFMAETAKILNPKAEVIIPTLEATCSLVTQTDLVALEKWATQYKDSVHVSYINSSAEHKAISDWIVTSANVEEIINSLIKSGKRVMFSPDRNMGAYLAYSHPEWKQYDNDLGPAFSYWTSVCEVHDKFKAEELEVAFREWTDGPKYLIAHPESPLPVLKKADMVGSTTKMLSFIKKFPRRPGTIYVATEEGLLYNMRLARPDLDIRLAPIYSGCQCNACPYMKMNTIENVMLAAEEGIGAKIDYLSDEIITKALIPIQRMLEFKE